VLCDRLAESPNSATTRDQSVDSCSFNSISVSLETPDSMRCASLRLLALSVWKPVLMAVLTIYMARWNNWILYESRRARRA